MKFVLFVMASFAWFIPQNIAEIKVPITPTSHLMLEKITTYNLNSSTKRFREKSVASNRKMNHRRTRSKPFQKNY